MEYLGHKLLRVGRNTVLVVEERKVIATSKEEGDKEVSFIGVDGGITRLCDDATFCELVGSVDRARSILRVIDDKSHGVRWE